MDSKQSPTIAVDNDVLDPRSMTARTSLHNGFLPLYCAPYERTSDSLPVLVFARVLEQAMLISPDC